jgi:hypothetical protein
MATIFVSSPAFLVEGNVTTGTIQLFLRNVSQASGSISLSFATDQSTASSADVSVPTLQQSFSISQTPARDYTFDPITITIRDDLFAEGTETIAIRITATGQVFENGSNSTIVRITLRDNDFAGGTGNDTLIGTQYNENFTGGAGADIIDAGPGFDVAFFGGTAPSTGVGFRSDGSVVVTGADGRDTLTGIEQLNIAGQMLDVASAAPIGNVYQIWGGRDAGVSELAYWIGEVGAGRATTGSIRAAILNDPLGQANTAAMLGDLYRQFIGREVTGGDIAYWDGLLRSGYTFADVRALLVAVPEGRANTAVVVDGLYREYIGRAAQPSDLDYWDYQVRSGQTFAGVRSALLADVAGGANSAARIDGLYDQYIGRDPTSGEIAFWTGEVGRGADFAVVRSALVADASGRAHTAATVAALYGDLLGRQPTADEQTYWAGQVASGSDFAAVRAALVDDASGRTHVAQVIDGIYRDYGGRAATGDDGAYWSTQVRAGASFATVRDAVLDDQLGSSYTKGALNGLYLTLFGRDASNGDQHAWHDLFHRGYTLDSARSALSFDAGSTGRVTKVTGTTGADTFVFSAESRHLAISNFDPAQDTIDLRGFGLSGSSVLDTAHAREVHNLNGGTDAFITIDAQTDVLLKGVSITQLNSADFLL